MTIVNRASAETLLTQVARMAVKAGKTVKGGAGNGYVGILNGYTVKMATHYGERGSGKAGYGEMKAACDTLRTNLQQAAELMLDPGNKDQKKALDTVLGLLGLDAKHAKVADKPLISREIALKVVTTINKAAGAESLSDKLTDVEGEATIRNSRADQLISAHEAAFQRHDAFLADMQKALDFYYPGTEGKAQREALEASIEQAFVYRGGALKLSGFAGSLEGEGEGSLKSMVDIRKVDSFASCFGTLIGNKGDPKGELFQTALAKLYLKWDDAAPEWNVKSVCDNGVPPASELPVFTMPSSHDGATFADKRLVMLKTIATVIFPQNAGPNKACFQTWFMNGAAQAKGKSVMDLTMDDLADFAEANWPDEEGTGPAFTDPNNHRKTNLADFFGDVAFGGGLRDMCNDRNQPVKALFVAALRGNDAHTNAVYGLMSSAEIGNKRLHTHIVLLPGNNAVFDVGGGLVAQHKETFTYGTEGHRATSTVTPRRKHAVGPDKAQVVNLAETEITRVNPETHENEVLFRGVRFGSCNLYRRQANIPLQYAHYGQLVEAALLANKELCASLKDGATIQLDLCRVDMSDFGDLKTCAASYKVTIGNKTVTVQPKVSRFRVMTDGAVDVKNANGKVEKRLLSKADVDETTAALKTLVDTAQAKIGDPLVKKLVDQLEGYWKGVQERHGEKDGSIRLFEGFGSEMLQFGARILLLANKLGMAPTFNCNGGRDRTGLMDTEVKTLSLHLAEGGDLPEISYAEPGLKELRTTVRDESGNQDIAREIKLNNADMYTDQVTGAVSQAENGKGVRFPAKIDNNAGDGQIDWTIKSHNCGPGLDTLFIQPPPVEP